MPKKPVVVNAETLADKLTKEGFLVKDRQTLRSSVVVKLDRNFSVHFFHDMERPYSLIGGTVKTTRLTCYRDLLALLKFYYHQEAAK